MQHSKKQTKQVEQALALLTTTESQELVFNHFMVNLPRQSKRQAFISLYNDFFIDDLKDFSDTLTMGSLVMLQCVSTVDDMGGKMISIEYTNEIRNLFSSLVAFNMGVRDITKNDEDE